MISLGRPPGKRNKRNYAWLAKKNIFFNTFFFFLSKHWCLFTGISIKEMRMKKLVRR